MATNLNPKFSEAIDLKSRVQGVEVSSVDNSSIRGFVADSIIRDRGVSTTQPAEEMTPATGAGAASIERTGPTAKATATQEQASATAAEPTSQPATEEPAPAQAEAAAPTAPAAGTKTPSKSEGVASTPAKQPAAEENATTETAIDPLEGAAPVGQD
jgi:hypothetical protein